MQRMKDGQKYCHVSILHMYIHTNHDDECNAGAYDLDTYTVQHRCEYVKEVSAVSFMVPLPQVVMGGGADIIPKTHEHIVK